MQQDKIRKTVFDIELVLLDNHIVKERGRATKAVDEFVKRLLLPEGPKCLVEDFSCQTDPVSCLGDLSAIRRVTHVLD